MLFDDGVLVRDGAVTIARPLTSIETPSTVKGILAARIDKLAPADKELLQTLAVIGKEFPIDLIRRIVGKPDDEMAPMLATCKRPSSSTSSRHFPRMSTPSSTRRLRRSRTTGRR